MLDNVMASLLRFFPLVLRQQISRQSLPRTPEPDEVMTGEENVAQYDQMNQTHLALSYAAALRTVHRAAATRGREDRALDLGCGPGHFTLHLEACLKYGKTEGVDLSEPMIGAATENARRVKSAARLRVGDAADVNDAGSSHYSLVCFNQSAHHMPDLAFVERVLTEMERVAKPDGLIIVTDLVRLKTAPLTERYVYLIGEDYHDLGLPDFFEDFHNSMYAAWTPDELREAIPTTTKRYWRHLVPSGLPTIQILVGLPEGRSKLYLRSGVPWTAENSPVPRHLRLEWNLLQATLALGSKRAIPPGG